MVNISFEINGQRVNPSQIGNALEAAMLKSIQESVAAKIRGIRDPKTGLPPKVTIKGQNLKNLQFKVEGSEEVVELIQSRLR